jgi:hypothetical protein
MPRIVLAAALAAASLITTAKAETVFVGNAFIDYVSPSPALCVQTFKVNDYFRVIFRPRGGALGNGGDSHLAVVGPRTSFVMRVPGNDFGPSRNYVSQGVSSQAVIGAGSGGITVWQQSPGAIGAGTPNVEFKGRFANYFRIKNCFVELRGNLVKR